MNTNSDPIKTRYPSPLKLHTSRSEEEKIAQIEKHFGSIMEILGLDLSDTSLARTPYRVARMYVNEIFSGLLPENFPKITTMENKYQHDGNSNMVFMKVHFTSFCEHHFVPMVGFAYVGYLPNKKLIGLSKIPRIVRYFSRRPQIQERLAAQIADSLATLLETQDIAVSITAEHYCVMARGVEDEESLATTNVLRGAFQDAGNSRDEFFEAIARS